MNINDIKYKAKSVFQKRSNIISVYIFISVIIIMTNYLAQLSGFVLPLVPIFIIIAMLPFNHGNIVTALKTVNEQGDEISIEKEGLTGFKRFKELFYTYFIKELLLVVIIIFVLLFMSVIAKTSVETSVFEDLAAVLAQTTDITALINTPAFNNAVAELDGLIFIGITVVSIVIIMYSLTFALTPYLLEKYNLKGVKALGASARLMRGYKGILFLLYLSYIGWAVLLMFISSAVSLVLTNRLIFGILINILSIYLFKAELYTSIAVFFEEVDLENKNNY